MSLTHMAQSNPKYFFSKKNRQFLKRAYTKGGLKHSFIKSACEAVILTNTLCQNLKQEVEYCLIEWELENKSEKFSYVECNN